MFGEITTALGGLAAIFQIFLVNLALSGDNAVVIALAASRLPAVQRRQAVLWGVTLAVALRIILTCLATLLVQVPGLMVLGGIVLYYVAYKLLVGDGPADASDEGEANGSPANLFAAVRMICVADMAMSLDNVLAVAGASGGNQIHMFIGLVSSVLFIVLLSNFIAAVMDRYQWLFYVGAGILAFTATQMIVTSHEMATLWGEGEQLVGAALAMAGVFPASLHLPDGWVTWPIQIAAVGGCLGIGHLRRRSMTVREDGSECGGVHHNPVAVCGTDGAGSEG